MNKSNEILATYLEIILKETTALHTIIYDFVYKHSENPGIHVCQKKRSLDEFVGDFENSYKDLYKAIAEVNSCLCRKMYTNEHLAEQAFDLECYDDAINFPFQSQVIQGSLKRQYDKIKLLMNNQDFDKNPNLQGFFLFLADTLLNCSEFYYKMSLWKELDLSKCGRSMLRRQLSAKEIYFNSLQLSRRIIYINDISVVPISIFQLRQSIELRICEILGIKAVVNEKNEFAKITADRFLEVKSLEDNYIFPVKKSIILKIHKWSNLFIHRGFVDDYWLLEFAFYLLDEFITKNLFVRDDYYNSTLIERLSLYLNIPKERIKRVSNNNNICLVNDDKVFENHKKNIIKMGYTKYEDKLFMDILERVNK